MAMGVAAVMVVVWLVVVVVVVGAVMGVLGWGLLLEARANREWRERLLVR
jgi:hypothetical protein